MTLGLVMMLAALAAFGCLGLISKLADLRGCHPSALYAGSFLWGSVFGILSLWISGASFARVPGSVFAIAAPFGAAAAVGGLAFQTGIRYGKISTSWLILNLSAAVPAALSAWIYREALKPRKLAAMGLVLAAVVFLWKDRIEELNAARARAAREEPCGRD